MGIYAACLAADLFFTSSKEKDESLGLRPTYFMKKNPCILTGSKVTLACTIFSIGVAFTSIAAAAGNRKSPTSKIFIADLAGEAQISLGDRIESVAKKSVYYAQGTVIETKDGSTYSMVFSNGTGSSFSENTRLEIKRFVQEPFTPNRTDMDVEPSISQTTAFLSRGLIGLCLSKQVAGSNTTVQTAHGSVNVRGKKAVVEAGTNETKVSMVEGDSSVKGGDLDLGGNVVKEGEQAIIRKGAAGQPNSIEIVKIPDGDKTRLDEAVALACLAKRTVYFDVQERPANETELAALGGDGGRLSTFDGNQVPDNRTTPLNAGGSASTQVPLITTVPEILVIEVVPENPPGVPVSASRLPGT